jgi:hypothetical protein
MKPQPLVTAQSLIPRPVASSSIAAVAPRAVIHQRQGADSLRTPANDTTTEVGSRPAPRALQDANAGTPERRSEAVEIKPTAQSAPATRKSKRSCLLPGGYVDQAAFERLVRSRIGGLT